MGAEGNPREASTSSDALTGNTSGCSASKRTGYCELSLSSESSKKWQRRQERSSHRSPRQEQLHAAGTSERSTPSSGTAEYPQSIKIAPRYLSVRNPAQEMACAANQPQPSTPTSIRNMNINTSFTPEG